MTTARLSDLQTLDEVALASGVDRSRLEQYTGASDQAASYTLLKIPKRGRRRRSTFRIVYKASATWLSNFHRSMAMVVVNSGDFGEHVQGFVKRRCTFTNAKRHLGARLLLHGNITGS